MSCFPKDVWCWLFGRYFDCRSVITCYYTAKELRRFMTPDQAEVCRSFVRFKDEQKKAIRRLTNNLQFGLCSICGHRFDWDTLSKHQRACSKRHPAVSRADFCKDCACPLPFVVRPHLVKCPFSTTACSLCLKPVLAIEDGRHCGCEVECRKCHESIPARDPQRHTCGKQCMALVKAARRAGKTRLSVEQRRCSRKQHGDSKFCFQHTKK